MMRALYAGISGLKNHQTRMDVIGNNIANVNTTGFKGSSVTFQDMLSQTVQGASAASGGLGGTNPVQIGMGMGVASINTIFTDGSLQATGKQTDLAISGQGFFVLTDGTNQVYTRAGGFDFDTAGNLLVPGTGYKVMGYKADSTGVISANQSLQAIQIPVGTSMAAKISSTLTYANNLMSSAKAFGTPAQIAAANSALTAAQLATAAAATKTAAAAALNPTALDTAAAAAIVTGTPADIAAAAAVRAAIAADLVAAGNLATATTANTNATNAKGALTATPADTTALANVATAYALLTPTAKASVDAKAALSYDSTNPIFIANDAAATSALIAGDAALITTYNTTYATLSVNGKAINDTTAAVASTTATLATATATKTASAAAITTAASTATTPSKAMTIAAATTVATAQAVADATKDAATAATNEATAIAAVAAANDKSSDALASIDVYDSQGNAYPLSGTFEKTSDNTWSFTPATTIKNAAGAVIANVTTSAPIVISFNADGSFQQSTTAAKITIDQTGLTPASPYAGAGAFSITPDFSTMTQYGIVTSVAATGQNGYTSGSLTKTSINTSGIIVGQFDNGQTLNLAQVALANFNNPSGLGKSGESLFVKTTNSGEPQVGTAGTAGRGTFNSGSLEMSNVDLAQQFSDMIVTQRGFQANSKIITTVDTMLEELVNLKR